MGTDADDELTGSADIDGLADELATDSVAFVDELNDRIGTVLADAESLSLEFVVGDISDAGTSSNSHLHFDLVHEGSSIHCVIFEYRLDRIDPAIEDGLQIAVQGDLSYYEDEGQMSIIVEDIVELGDGLYERTYRENKQALETDGLLDDDAKQPLPALPERVGIVTSAESDAREDAVTSIHGRFPDIDIHVHNASMQGEEAMESIMAAIFEFDRNARVDVIVLTRGGGADKHLRVFNELSLCRMIANTETPFVVGVGHENDESLAGMVADARAMTPTEVGEAVVPVKSDLVGEVSTLETRLDRAYRRVVIQRLSKYEERLNERFTQEVTGELETLQTTLNHAFETTVSEKLVSLDERLEAAFQKREQQSEHEDEAEELEATIQRHQVVIALLVLLLGALSIALFVALYLTL